MNKKISIISLACAPFAVEAYDETVKCLEKKGCEITHIGFSVKNWIPSDYHDVSMTYRKFNYPVFVIPRVNPESMQIACVPDYRFEFQRSFAEIHKWLVAMIRQYHPDIFLIDNERPVTILIAKMLKEDARIPVIAFGYHSFIYSYNRIYRNIYWKKIIDLFRLFKYGIPKRIKRLLGKNDWEIFVSCPKVDLFGENESDIICSASGIDTKTMIKYGVSASKIIEVGSPYFDKAVNYKNKFRTLVDKRSKKKILIISSAFAYGNKSKIINNYYELVCRMVNKLSDKYDFYLRFKPSVMLPDFLPKRIKKIINKIKTDDNSKTAYEAIYHYDLIMGDVSFVLYEALIGKRPIAMFNYRQPQNVSEINFLKKEVGIKEIKIENTDSEIDSIISVAFSKKYLELILKNFKNQEYNLFYKLDGKCGERAAAIITKTLSN